MGGKRLTYESVKQFIEIDSKSGCVLLSNEFTGHMQKLNIQCKCGDAFQRDYKNFRLGHYYCKECKSIKLKKDRRKSHDQFINDLKNVHQNEYIVLEEYVNSYTKIKVKHNIESCNFVWKTAPDSLLKGHGCPKCAGKYRKDTDFFKKEVYDLVGDEYEILSEYKGSNRHVVIRHVNCGNSYEVNAHTFLSGRRCPYCAKLNRRIDTDILYREIKEKTNNEYELMSEYKNSLEQILIKHHECDRVYEATLNNFRGGARCPYCCYGAKKDTETYKKDLFNVAGDDFTLMSEYIDSRTKVTIVHNICNYVMEVAPSSFLKNLSCPKCSNNIKRTTDEFKKEVNELTNGEYEVLSEYTNSRTKIKIKHNVCNCLFDSIPYTFLKNKNNTQCPKCFGSRGEAKVHEVLLQLDIKYKSEFWFSDCRNILPLPFDFAIFNDNENIMFLIEYDGEQHYKVIRYSKDKDVMIKTLNDCQMRDQIKNEYCKQNNIPLLRIPYWEFDNIENIVKDELHKYNLLEINYK